MDIFSQLLVYFTHSIGKHRENSNTSFTSHLMNIPSDRWLNSIPSNSQLLHVSVTFCMCLPLLPSPQHFFSSLLLSPFQHSISLSLLLPFSLRLSLILSEEIKTLNLMSLMRQRYSGHDLVWKAFAHYIQRHISFLYHYDKSHWLLALLTQRL